jgi:hypothetical protein
MPIKMGWSCSFLADLPPQLPERGARTGAGKATFNPLSLKLPSNELPQLDNLLFTAVRKALEDCT